MLIGHTTFEGAARMHAKARGLPDLHMLFHEPPAAGVVGEEVEATDQQLRFVIDALTGGAD